MECYSVSCNRAFNFRCSSVTSRETLFFYHTIVTKSNGICLAGCGKETECSQSRGGGYSIGNHLTGGIGKCEFFVAKRKSLTR